MNIKKQRTLYLERPPNSRYNKVDELFLIIKNCAKNASVKKRKEAKKKGKNNANIHNKR